MKIYIILLLLSIPIICREPVYFKQSQPAGVGVSDNFPSEFVGKYVKAGNDSMGHGAWIITVTNKKLVFDRIEAYFHEKFLYKFDEHKISNDSVFDREGQFISVLTRYGDSVKFVLPINIEEFTISDSTFLKIYNNMCFLNYAKGSQFQTDVMFFEDSRLIHASIKMTKEIEKLQKLSNDTASHQPVFHLDPTIDKLVEYIKNGGFADRDTFVKFAN